jgi:hypothetical protein
MLLPVLISDMAVNFSHCKYQPNEVTFVCIPIFWGDATLFCEIGARGDKLFAFDQLGVLCVFHFDWFLLFDMPK